MPSIYNRLLNDNKNSKDRIKRQADGNHRRNYRQVKLMTVISGRMPTLPG